MKRNPITSSRSFQGEHIRVTSSLSPTKMLKRISVMTSSSTATAVASR
jgi:hypothetical protein